VPNKLKRLASLTFFISAKELATVATKISRAKELF
jgi:hypothetical protein